MATKRRFTGLSAAVVAVAALAACGGGDSDAAEDGGATSAETTVLHVGETAGVPSAFLAFGVEQGIFAEHGLELEIDTSAGGAAAIPALMGNNLDIAGSNVVSSLLAAAQGLPLRIIAPGTFATDDLESDFSAVLVPADSPITSADGLATASVAVNTLENIGDITITAALEERGIDTSNVDFVELGFPEMLPALDNGQVDAAWIIEPFLTMGLEQGHRPVLWPYVEAKEGLQIGSFVVTEQFLQENQDAVDRFRAALADTAALVTEDPEVFRQALPELQELDPAIAEQMVLPQYKDDVDVDSLEFVAERMLDAGYIDEPIDVDAIVAR